MDDRYYQIGELRERLESRDAMFRMMAADADRWKIKFREAEAKLAELTEACQEAVTDYRRHLTQARQLFPEDAKPNQLMERIAVLTEPEGE